jgi:hypothetical protein
VSTKAPHRLLPVGLVTVAAALWGCAHTPPGEPASHFSQLRFGGTAAPPLEPSAPVVPPAVVTAHTRPPPTLRPRLPAPEMPAAVLPVSLTQAQARVTAYLDRAGFALEARPEGGGALLSATRMGPPRALDGEAVCALEAMRRPTLSSTDLTVRLSPMPGGVQLQTNARFVEVDTKILSGDLARETCRSRGVLESAVQRAALGG